MSKVYDHVEWVFLCKLQGLDIFVYGIRFLLIYLFILYVQSFSSLISHGALNSNFIGPQIFRLRTITDIFSIYLLPIAFNLFNLLFFFRVKREVYVWWSKEFCILMKWSLVSVWISINLLCCLVQMWMRRRKGSWEIF